MVSLYTFHTTLRNVISLLVKFTLYTEKNSVKWTLHEFYFTRLFIKDKNLVMWGLATCIKLVRKWIMELDFSCQNLIVENSH